jgi:hypothetical protein
MHLSPENLLALVTATVTIVNVIIAAIQTIALEYFRRRFPTMIPPKLKTKEGRRHLSVKPTRPRASHHKPRVVRTTDRKAHGDTGP